MGVCLKAGGLADRGKSWVSYGYYRHWMHTTIFGVRVPGDLAGMFGTNRCLVETAKRLGLGGGPVLTNRERFARKRWWPGCTGVRLRVREGFAGAGRAGPCIAGRGARVGGAAVAVVGGELAVKGGIGRCVGERERGRRWSGIGSVGVALEVV